MKGSTCKIISMLVVCALLAFSSIWLLPASAHAQDKYWIGGSGWWDDGSNWNPLGQPQDGDNVYLTFGDSIDRTILYRNTAYPNDILDKMYIDSTDFGSTTLRLDEADPLFVNNEYIGRTNSPGRSAIQQSAGTHTVHNRMYIENDSGSSLYDLNGGNLIVGELVFYPEHAGYATFNQNGGINTVTSKLEMYGGSGGHSIYNLTDGSLFVGDLIMGGMDSFATFNQSGGLHEADSLSLGGYYFNQTYNLSDGSLLVKGDEKIGEYQYSDSSFNQSGGIHTILGSLFVGTGSGGNHATFNLSGGILSAKAAQIGEEISSTTTTFNQTGGIHNISETLTIVAKGYSVYSHTYNLIDGTLTAGNIVNNDTFNYSGGDLNANLTNNATTTLSGSGVRIVNGDVTNNGTFEVSQTTAKFTGSLINNDYFLGNSSIAYFNNLSIGNSGTMEGSGVSPWFIEETLAGVTFDQLGETVSNIQGSNGFSAYYNPANTNNQYLGGKTYDLSGSGQLIPLDAIVKTNLDYYLNITLDETLSFDYWWEMGTEPNDFNLDLLVYRSGMWEILGWNVNLNGSSTDWRTAYYLVPQRYRGLNTQIKFAVYDFGMQTDPTVYLKDIKSDPVPEPSTMLLLGTGLVGLAGVRRKFRR